MLSLSVVRGFQDIPLLLNMDPQNCDLSEESDENEEISKIMSNTLDVDGVNQRNDAKSKVVIVSGEASESEDEVIVSTVSSIEDNVMAGNSIDDQSQPSDATTKSTKTKATRHPVKHKSLLHKKLRERNIALQRHINDFLHHPFQTATRDVNNITQQLIKTQLNIQDLAPILRQMTNDLFHLEDKMDTLQDIAACIPDIALEDESIVRDSESIATPT